MLKSTIHILIPVTYIWWYTHMIFHWLTYNNFGFFFRLTTNFSTRTSITTWTRLETEIYVITIFWHWRCFARLQWNRRRVTLFDFDCQHVLKPTSGSTHLCPLVSSHLGGNGTQHMSPGFGHSWMMSGNTCLGINSIGESSL